MSLVNLDTSNQRAFAYIQTAASIYSCSAEKPLAIIHSPPPRPLISELPKSLISRCLETSTLNNIAGTV